MSTDPNPTTLEEMRELTPEQFEDFVSKIYSAKGYDTKRIQMSNDGGRDVVADKDGERAVIQAKRYSEGNRIGTREIGNYSSLLHEDDVDRVDLVTTSTLTNQGWKRANRIENIEIVDGDILENWATKYNDEMGTATDYQKSESSSEYSGIEKPSLPSPSTELAWLISSHPKDKWRNMITVSIFLLVASFGGLFLSDAVSSGNIIAILSLWGMGIGWIGSTYSVYRDMSINTNRSRIAMLYATMIVATIPLIAPLAYLKMRKPQSDSE